METQVNLPFITADASGPKHLDMKLTRAKFEELTRNLIERCRGPVLAALEDARMTEKDLDEVILVGGSTRIPAVQVLVRGLTGKDPHQGVNPDEVVAIGAAIQGGVLAGEVKDVLLLDVTPLSLGLETLGGVMSKIIERNTTIPVRRSQVFSTADDNQASVEINVLQGEREMALDNRSLGHFKLDGISPAPRGVPQVEVTFDIDADGMLKVSAQDRSTGKEQAVVISGSTSLNQAEVDRMVRQAEMYAAEDNKRKQEAEVRNEADSAAYQVERQLKDLGDGIPVHEKARVEQLLQELQASLKENAPIAGIQALSEDLRQAAHALFREACRQAGNAGGGYSDAAGSSPPGDVGDFVDAEFEEK
jgi:molecular chaperone DnaK